MSPGGIRVESGKLRPWRAGFQFSAGVHGGGKAAQLQGQGQDGARRVWQVLEGASLSVPRCVSRSVLALFPVLSISALCLPFRWVAPLSPFSSGDFLCGKSIMRREYMCSGYYLPSRIHLFAAMSRRGNYVLGKIGSSGSNIMQVVCMSG